LDKDGNRINYNESSLQSISYYDYNGQRVFLDNVALKGSTLYATVPRPVRDEVRVNVNLNDAADHYLPVNKVFTVPSNSANTTTTEELLLLTKDGKGCVGLTGSALSQCWAGKQLQYTDVDVVVRDEESGDEVSGAAVKLYSNNGQNFLGSQVSDKYGKVKFPKLAFD